LLINKIMIVHGSITKIILTLITLIFSKEDLSLREQLIKQFDMNNSSPQSLIFHKKKINKICLIQPPKTIEKGKKYPLIISLHGYTESRTANFTPTIGGNKQQQEKYPCFFLAPSNRNSGWLDGATWVREVVSDIIELYPIDLDRIYLIGFSWGGSGSFPFAKALYQEYGIIPAAIIRCAGRSEAELIPEFKDKTAVWYNVGNNDSKAIQSTAQRFYDHAKRDQPYTTETIEQLTRGDYPQKTYTLMVEEKEFIKYSLYDGMGHEYEPVFYGESITNWLFSQSLR
jgi:predicted peptidase